jgi:argonaute-like protein implicated in RNA metabolism and viral defense
LKSLAFHGYPLTWRGSTNIGAGVCQCHHLKIYMQYIRGGLISIVEDMSYGRSDNQIETAIRVILFRGNKEDFETWLEKFRAKEKHTGFKDHNAGTAGDILKSIDGDTNTSDDETKALKKLKKTIIAFTELLLSIHTSTPQGKIAFKCLMGKKTSEYPDGHARNGMARLIQKYLPKTAPTLVIKSSIIQVQPN